MTDENELTALPDLQAEPEDYEPRDEAEFNTIAAQ